MSQTVTRQKAEALNESVGQCESCGDTIRLTQSVVVPIELESGRTIAVTTCESCAPAELPEV